MPQTQPTTAPAPTHPGPATLANLVGGRWVRAGGETIEDRDPATGALLAHVPLSTRADVDAAVRAAVVAAAGWRETSPMDRARAIFRLREELRAHRDELADLITRDMGKTLADARAEVARGIESCEYACSTPELLKGETLEGVSSGVDVELVRQPVGVVAAITPFNFPVMIPLWFLPYAVAAGNAVVLKPSERDPLAAQRLIELAAGIDELPVGVVSVVHGAHEAVDALLDHPDVAAISFVGQAATARYVAGRAAEAGKRVQALGGAKNALVVMPDADPELMAAGVTASAFGAAGQRCLAGSVAVLVGSEEQQERSRELIVEAARALRVGAGGDPDTDVCPLVDARARERVEADVDRAVSEGARLALDGRSGGGEGGAEMAPTILEGAVDGTRAMREELFGPVLTLVGAPDLEGAVEWINAGRYGNASVIFTASGGAAREFRRHVQAGMVGINVGVAAPVAWFPFAGWKDSFDGDLHANGRDSVAFYTRTKVVTSRWA